ncbi:MAG: hypothetical protein AB1571_00175 [Nanoarchaeota archaeon]
MKLMIFGIALAILLLLVSGCGEQQIQITDRESKIPVDAVKINNNKNI